MTNAFNDSVGFACWGTVPVSGAYSIIATLLSYTLEGVEADSVPRHTRGDRIKLVEPETGCRRLPVMRPGPGGEGSGRCPLRNLAPADLKKDANGFDLPIALGLLLAFDRPGMISLLCSWWYSWT